MSNELLKRWQVCRARLEQILDSDLDSMNEWSNREQREVSLMLHAIAGEIENLSKQHGCEPGWADFVSFSEQFVEHIRTWFEDRPYRIAAFRQFHREEIKQAEKWLNAVSKYPVKEAVAIADDDRLMKISTIASELGPRISETDLHRLEKKPGFPKVAKMSGARKLYSLDAVVKFLDSIGR